MSDHRLEGIDTEGAACSSLNGMPQTASSVVSEHLPDGSRETDTVCVLDNAVTTVDAVAAPLPVEAANSNQNSSSVDNVSAKECSVGENANEGNVPEACGAAAAAACAEDSDGLSDLDSVIARHREMVNRVKAEREEFVRRMQLAEAEVRRSAEQMYGAVDNRVNELLASAEELKAERASQFEQASSQMQTSLASMNYHHLFAKHLLKYGTPAEMTHYAPLLHADAERILSEPIPQVPEMSSESEEKWADLQAFASLNLDEVRRQVGGNLVGHITRTEAVDYSLPEGESPYFSQPRLIAATAVYNGVCGLAFLGEQLFVLRDRSSIVEVCITSEELVLSRQINVEQMTSPTSIAACTSANCLFVSDSQVRGLFRIPSCVDTEVTLIPLDGIPSSLSLTANGSIVLTLADTQVIQTISAADGSITGEIQIGAIDRPVSAVPVNGEDNGFVVCSETENGLQWFVCGHRLEEAARSLEEPVHLRSLSDTSGLVPDPFGSYVAFSSAQSSVKLFNSTFEFLRPVLSGSESVEHPTALALNTTSGRVAIGQQNGVIKLYQLLRTRETIEVGICNWA